MRGPVVVVDGLCAGEQRLESIQGLWRAFGHAAVRKRAGMHATARARSRYKQTTRASQQGGVCRHAQECRKATALCRRASTTDEAANVCPPSKPGVVTQNEKKENNSESPPKNEVPTKTLRMNQANHLQEAELARFVPIIRLRLREMILTKFRVYFPSSRC